jgi:hypothetical protein
MHGKLFTITINFTEIYISLSCLSLAVSHCGLRCRNPPRTPLTSIQIQFSFTISARARGITVYRCEISGAGANFCSV